mgnify:CR=1 FL=1
MLAPGQIEFEALGIHLAEGKARHLRRGRHGLGQIHHEGFRGELPQKRPHGGVLDDFPVINDRNVAAQGLGLFQIVSSEDDGGARQFYL